MSVPPNYRKGSRSRSTQIVGLRSTIVFGLLLGTTALSGGLYAQEAGLAAGDCTEIDLAFTDTKGPLTDSEISALREARHQASLNQFDRCVTALNGGGQGGGQGSGAGNGSGSVAATGVAGTQTTITEPLTTPPQVEPDRAEQDPQPDAAIGPGRAPIDIPPADTDGALAAQIRRAAEAETDPTRRDRLWNEYRKIKGLPTS